MVCIRNTISETKIHSIWRNENTLGKKAVTSLKSKNISMLKRIKVGTDKNI